MDFPRVSVLLSSYNHERYVKRSIDSVLAQTFRDFELIIVDDGSTDHSAEIIRSFADSRIKAFFLNPNQGMGLAFNFAIKQATGTYLARIDSDDFWDPRKLEKQLDYMEHHPSVGACFSWATIIDPNEQEVSSLLCDRSRLFRPTNRSQAEWLHHFYTHGNTLCHTSAFIRREAVEQAGLYNCALRQLQDLDLWLRIVKRYPLHVLCEPLVYYRWLDLDTPNVSAPTQDSVTRTIFEFFQVLHDFHENLPDELFKAAFGQDFIFKPAATRQELLCERALLLLRHPSLGQGGKILALLRLNQLLQQDDTRAVLGNTYHFSVKDYNALCGERVFADSPLLQTEDSLGRVYGEISLRELVKKHLKRHPMVYSCARKLSAMIGKA